MVKIASDSNNKMGIQDKENLADLLPPRPLEGIEYDLLTRTSWIDAHVAYAQIKKERANGNQASLWLRSRLQEHLYETGCAIQRNPGKILFVGLLILATFCVGLKSVNFEYELERLWIEEGGRVTRELDYIRTKLGVSTGDKQQVIIQTPNSGAGANVLRPDVLLAHVDLLREALQVEVELYEQSWTLQDICIKPSVPSFNHHYIDQIFETVMPCTVITPLDCFWEGSKLLSLWYPMTIETFGIHNLTWLNLNPMKLLKTMKESLGNTDFPFESMENFMARAGITTAYQEKPCLNPDDPQCPDTAPNKKSRRPPDIGATLTGGCYGFATTYMHWPDSLVVGGIQKNRSGTIARAGALQSIIEIMDDKSMFEFHDGRYNLHNADWSTEKAREIIEAWQRKFANEVERLSGLPQRQKQRFNVFTFNALTNVLRSFTRPDIQRLIIGASILLVYVCIALVNLQKPELSQACAGFFGVLLLLLSITAAFGLCALLGLTFNATTTQVLPFLALGLGCNSIFLLTHTLNKIISSGAIPIEEQTGECLKRTGVTIILSNASLVLAFVAASIIPIPALRYFSLQAAILLICSLAAVLLLFPAVFSVDLHRRAARRLDLFCCIVKEQSSSEEANRRATATTLVANQPLPFREDSFVKPIAVISIDENAENELRLRRQRGLDDGCFGWSVSYATTQWYIPLIHLPVVRTAVVLSFLLLVAFGLWGTMRLEDGLELSDLIPKGSNEYEYLRHQQRYFGMYRIFAVTQSNFEYPTNQRLLYEYHNAFTRVEKIVKNDDGGLPEFWLSLFRDWLLGLQNAFDHEWNLGYIKQEGWNQSASNEAILAYKLMVQTGRVENPVDKSLLTSNRLVKEDGIINPKAFYHYLTVWYNSDPLAYSASQASLVPQPKQWDDIPRAQEFKILKSSAIHFAQLPFYLRDLNSTREITETISQLRSICANFEERGLPNFPTGLPLVYWEQYLHLRFYLAVAVTLILVAVFVIISSVLLNVWSALIIVVVLSACVLQVLGALSALSVPLSAVPGVLIVISVGMGVDTTLHLTVGYLTSLGGRTRRVSMALEYMSAPIVHATVSTLLGVAMLAFSEFDFVIRHFSHLLSAIVAIYAYNSFVVLPVLLTLIGPPGELVPHKNRDQIDPPTPQPSPVLEPRNSRSISRPQSRVSRTNRMVKKPHLFPRSHSELSLSTITEEPSSYQSTSPEPELHPTKIIVEPEIIVQTTTITNTASGLVSTSSSESSRTSEEIKNPSPTPSSASSGVESGKSSPTVVTTTDLTPHGTNVTTKVTTKVKVEFHGPSFMQQPHFSGNSSNDFHSEAFGSTRRPPSRRSYRPTDVANPTQYRRAESQNNGKIERNSNCNGSSGSLDTAAYPSYYTSRR